MFWKCFAGPGRSDGERRACSEGRMGLAVASGLDGGVASSSSFLDARGMNCFESILGGLTLAVRWIEKDELTLRDGLGVQGF